MLIGNKQMFYTCKAIGKKCKTALLFLLLLAPYNKEELMAYNIMLLPHKTKLKKYMSVFLFFSFTKNAKKKNASQHF